ncbi:hypothetical protein CROQUDRAFT_96759 [Cronartium quercuum f. sp. fusiforme G11]|uniref:PH domain-containing protein n=1 Tax=Cronartium quercuum f. sp. fusiforme G11 TaxID=708437 RepID=A0A9P6NF55_9BASI|nr:hypothetical protein CROQUDRAFT_96759 [Cronartium quercuum f. sp. fusiforme G11]
MSEPNSITNPNRSSNESSNLSFETKNLSNSIKLNPAIDESLRTFKLLEAIRSSNSSTILSLLNNLTHQKPTHEPQITPLHLSVRCATFPIIQLVLHHSPSNHINVQDSNGQTPLHIAALLGRSDVVSLLLNNNSIDDSIKDGEGKTCLEVSKNSETAKLIQISRAQLSGTFLALLSAYIASPITAIVSESAVLATSSITEGDPSAVIPSSTAIKNHESAADQLYKFMIRPRCRSIDFNVKEEQTGTTILHEAARRSDLHLLKIAINRGSDVLSRDKRNKMPIDVAKDEKVKSVLRQTATSEGKALLAHAQSKSIESTGLVTSSSSSSNLGGLSSTGTVPNASIPQQQQQPTLRGYLSKWTNMAKGYNTRWLVLHNGYLSYYRDQKDEGKAVRGSISMSVAIITGPDITKDKLRFEVSSKLGSSYPRFYLKGVHPVEVMRWVDALKQAVEVAKNTNPAPTITSAMISRQSSSPSIELEKKRSVARKLRNSLHFGNGSPSGKSNGNQDVQQHQQVNLEGSPQASLFAGSYTDDDSYGNEISGKHPPYETEFELLSQSIKAHIEMTSELVDSLTPLTTSNRQAELKVALKSSMKDLNQMVSDYFDKVQKRETFYVKKLDQEILAKKLWEENIQNIVASQAQMEKELQSVVRDSSRRKKQLRSLRAGMSGPAEGTENSSNLGQNLGVVIGSGGPSTPLTSIPSTSITGPGGEEEDVIESEDSDDEFFEAIETGLISVEPISISKPTLDSTRYSRLEISDLIEGYQPKRTTLPITADDRPSVSLWGILKNSIGKDLTKISFPVSFNEPISMLQRMAEDMQFSECLDAAAENQDSLVRLAYVAGFAMSNYASTVGRIAKPFNPLLGETFEYVEPDKQYRYVSEQISHHPPMSACYCESIRWKYYGETDAKNRFTGKSFEIKPTGVAHATLKLPKTYPNVDSYPQVKEDEERVEEHYSWKKVTTVISNFILGSPAIDHYGDMEITNHRTGERCILTFKPRGWRGKDANEIKGSVYDSNGKVVWEIAGKWTTQLIARRLGSASGELAPDASVAVGREYLQLWKNSEQPENMPFNLTPFAVTLNAISDNLKIWLPPTDCRLRPDQHAFERGAWEKANELKTALEENQRITKRRREAGELPEYEPRWFKPCEDEDTGERTWDAIRGSDGVCVSYWEERLKVGRARKEGEINTEWNKVDHIFGEFELIEG